MYLRTNTIRKTQPKFHHRKAFTLVELLVVIAIIGILVGLLLPAVQAAREAARRCMCANNIGQIGLAIHHYEFSREHLPPGVTNDSGPIENVGKGQHISWTVHILPYMEQRNTFENIDQKLGAYAAANSAAKDLEIAVFSCPSAPRDYLKNYDDWTFSRCSYAGCHHDSESPINSDNNGLLFLNSRITYNDILDGSSSTILLGEKIPIPEDLGWMSGTRATLRNTGPVAFPVPRRNRTAADSDPVAPWFVGGFGSFHGSGGNFVFADGSIHYLSQSIDKNIYKNLGNRSDGAMIGGVFDQ